VLSGPDKQLNRADPNIKGLEEVLESDSWECWKHWSPLESSLEVFLLHSVHYYFQYHK